MSSDEDTELRDLVAQTLEANGVLGKIRAQLRASVFVALEEQESSQNKNAFISQELKSFVKTKEGRQITALVREFLEFFKLEFTMAVFDPETGCRDMYDGRSSLARDLNIVESENTNSSPLLAQLFRRAGDSQTPRGKSGLGTESSSSSSNSIVENKNKRNIENNGHDSRSISQSSTPRGQQNGNEFEDEDAFFDDPVPNNDRMKTFSTGDKSKNNSDEKGSSMTSLSGLPALGLGSNVVSGSADSDVRSMNKRLGDLGLDMPDDDYDDDFESSNVSPVGHTPRSTKSDQNMKSLDDDIDEEIEEELSVAEDLLKSDNSGLDDLTTDRTVSPENQNSAFDYVEEVMS